MQKGKEDTQDLAGVSRFVPLLALLNAPTKLTEQEFINLVQQQTEITHANQIHKDLAAVFGSWAYHANLKPSEKPSKVFPLVKIPDSLKESVAKATALLASSLSDQDAVDSLGEIKEYGGKKIATSRSCAWIGALPATIFLILKHENEGLEAALKSNVLIGGDSAARGILIAAILSPYSESQGKSLPKGWLSDLQLKSSIEKLVDSVSQSKSLKEEL